MLQEIIKWIFDRRRGGNAVLPEVVKYFCSILSLGVFSAVLKMLQILAVVNMLIPLFEKHS